MIIEARRKSGRERKRENKRERERIGHLGLAFVVPPEVHALLQEVGDVAAVPFPHVCPRVVEVAAARDEPPPLPCHVQQRAVVRMMDRWGRGKEREVLERGREEGEGRRKEEGEGRRRRRG